MTQRTYLPFDVARCVGHAADDEGTLCKPCDTCARAYFTKPGQAGMWQPWIEPQRDVIASVCPNYISMEIEE